MDRTTKLLLAAIAVGLFANASASVVRPAGAQYNIASDISRMASDISALSWDTCTNRKLC